MTRTGSNVHEMRAFFRFHAIVDNLTEIAAAYGDSVAARVLLALSTRVERMFDLSADEVVISADGVVFSCRAGRAGDILRVAALPVDVDEVRIVIALRLVRIHDLSATDLDLDRDTTSGFRDDMRIAVDVADAVLSGSTYLVIQPIVHAAPTASMDNVLYWECLSRVTGLNGCGPGPDVFLPALERLRLTRFYDAHICQATIQLLRSSTHASLGCNISAQSALLDDWWLEVIEMLSCNRALASRLVIEITETAQTNDEEQCMAFVERLRALGCRIALDDFGRGFHHVDLARRIRPDIIKIDSCFLPRGDAVDQGAMRLLSRLVALAATLADSVVLEGVERLGDLAIAVQCGADWVQGYHVGVPAVPAVCDLDGDRVST